MKKGIMLTDAGFAGQAGYFVRKGDTVVLLDAPDYMGFDYFATPEDTDGAAIGINRDEVSEIVDYDDIKIRVEYDDWDQRAPWEDCDGWEHEFRGTGYKDHPRARLGYNYVNRPALQGGCGYIVVEDSDVIRWGCDGYYGCSKQVRAEAIAAAKRKATEQLVKWYEDGWQWYDVCAEWGDYHESMCGIDCPDYAQTVGREFADNIADNLEADGYTVINRPKRQNKYNRVEAFKLRIRHNLTGSWS